MGSAATCDNALFGVLYAEDFDAGLSVAPPPAGPPAPDPDPPEPSFTAAELAAARQQGLADGWTESERGVAATRTQMLALIARGMAEADQTSAAIAAEAAETTARTMFGALAAVLPATCAQHGADELRAFTRLLLPALTQEPRITVRVNPLMVPTMAAECDALDPALAARIVVEPAEHVTPGDVQVAWQDGAASRDSGRACAAIQDALATLGLLEREDIDA